MNNQYWALKTGDDLLNELKSKVTDYDDFLRTSGLFSELKDSYNSFYGDSRIRDVGVQGSMKAVKINHYASLVRNLVSLVTNNKPAWNPISSNTDSSSQASAILATGLLDFYLKDRRLDRTFRNACLMACFLREAWVSTTWDASKGEVIHIGDETQPPIHEGDLLYQLHSLNNVIRDYKKKNSDFDWLIVREQKNKWDLIAQFPDLSEQLSSSNVEDDSVDFYDSFHKETDPDNINVYTFYHKPCASLPQGRMVTFVNTILTDGPLPYSKIPLVKLSQEDLIGSSFSHSPIMDVLPLQKAIDTIASIILTNNAAFGVQNIQYPKGGSLSVRQVASGMNLLEYDSKLGKIESLQLTASAPETYRFFNVLINQAQLLSGINAAIRGQTTAGTSGAALALLSQQAIQFANGLSQGYVSLIEDVGTLSIQILQRYATTKRVAVLAGKHNQHLLKEWSAEDLQGISRITIESGNALSKTTSGRLTMADSLLQSGMIKSGEQYISVLQTGNLEPILESETSPLLRIRRENERLTQNLPVRAILTDDHSLDIREHMTILDNPDVRENDVLVSQVLNHVQEHLDLAKSMPIELYQLLNRAPIQSQTPQVSMPPPLSNLSEITDATNPITQAAQNVNQPNFPSDPRTGEEYNPSLNQ